MENIVTFSKSVLEKVQVARLKVVCPKLECKHFWTFDIRVIDGVATINPEDLECQECKRDEEAKIRAERQKRREQIMNELQFS